MVTVPESVAPVGHLAFVGLMGAGKTVVGRVLADRLRRRYVDLDRAITQLAGRSIGVIFQEGGESTFRDLEAQSLVLQLAAADPIVLSTGGGVLGRGENRAVLAADSIVVWLRARPETLADRVGDGVGRPLLEGRNALGVLRDLAEDRHPTYEQAANVVVDTDGLTVVQVVDAVLHALMDVGLVRPETLAGSTVDGVGGRL
ncbi:MAG: shikimate kinase [Actinomycetota bacterium]|nr:shikimate kinase [Actinomycetota bacterium]MED5233094.1 shikimate kinase [Actinomycetota bacterium]MEE3353300.1 shikimate kinase [Actinomycetota bacterium]